MYHPAAVKFTICCKRLFNTKLKTVRLKTNCVVLPALNCTFYCFIINMHRCWFKIAIESLFVTVIIVQLVGIDTHVTLHAGRVYNIIMCQITTCLANVFFLRDFF